MIFGPYRPSDSAAFPYALRTPPYKFAPLFSTTSRMLLSQPFSFHAFAWLPRVPLIPILSPPRVRGTFPLSCQPACAPLSIPFIINHFHALCAQRGPRIIFGINAFRTLCRATEGGVCINPRRAAGIPKMKRNMKRNRPALHYFSVKSRDARDCLPWGIHPDPPVPQQAHPSLP